MHTPLSSIACLLLAAGRSERFGPLCKLSRDWRGKALGDHIADRLAALAFGAHVAVTRAGGFAPADACYSRAPITQMDAGIAHSISTGIGAIAGKGFSAVLIVLADMPFVPDAHLLRLVAHYDGDGVATICGGRKQVPALFGAAHFPGLMGLEGDAGASVLLKHVGGVPADPAWLMDFDRPEDFI